MEGGRKHHVNMDTGGDRELLVIKAKQEQELSKSLDCSCRKRRAKLGV